MIIFWSSESEPQLCSKISSILKKNVSKTLLPAPANEEKFLREPSRITNTELVPTRKGPVKEVIQVPDDNDDDEWDIMDTI